MVKFGKFLNSVRSQKWSSRYFSYKQFRSLLRLSSDIREKFFHLLDSEVAKVSRFLVATALESRAALARLSAHLAPQRKPLLAERNVRIAVQYAREIVALAKDMRELAMFMDVNLVAIHKVLKKYNKKTNSLTSHEYVQARSGERDSLLPQLWDTSLIESFASDLAAVTGRLSVAESAPEALLEHVEMVEILSEQIEETVSKVHANMPLERYMSPTVPLTAIFDRSPAFSHRDAVCVTMLVLYAVNNCVSYADSRAYGESLGIPRELLGGLLACTPFFGLLVTVCHGFMREVDYKLPLLYSILMCVTGNSLFAVARVTGSAMSLVVGRAFLGLGDPTMLLLFYFSAVATGLLRTKACVKTVALMTACESFSWAIQAGIRYFPAISPLSGRIFPFATCAALWAFTVLPFQAYFRTPSLPPKRDSELSFASPRRPLLALCSLTAIATMSEAVTVGAVTLLLESRTACVMAGASAVSAMSLLLVSAIRQRKLATVACETLSVAALLHISLLDSDEITDLRPSALFPLLLVLIPKGLGVCLLWKILKRETPFSLQKHLLQAVYTLFVAGRVVGGLAVTLASAGSSFLHVWLICLIGVGSVATVATVCL